MGRSMDDEQYYDWMMYLIEWADYLEHANTSLFLLDDQLQVWDIDLLVENWEVK